AHLRHQPALGAKPAGHQGRQGRIRMPARSNRAFVAVQITFLLGAAVTGCRSGDTAVDAGVGLSADASDDGSTDFRVVLGNAISDTLTDNAEFGILVEPQSRSYRFVIRLYTGFDFAGGIIFARSDTSLPEPGEYRLTAPTDSMTVDDGGFSMFYREGMIR